MAKMTKAEVVATVTRATEISEKAAALPVGPERKALKREACEIVKSVPIALFSKLPADLSARIMRLPLN